MANTLLDGHGVEAINAANSDDEPHALYVNLGDPYVTTVLFDVRARLFEVISYGDWIEKNQRKYKINPSGYAHCTCRDCMEIAIADDDGVALCSDCEEAGCSAEGYEHCRAWGGGAYGIGIDEREENPMRIVWTLTYPEGVYSVEDQGADVAGVAFKSPRMKRPKHIGTLRLSAGEGLWLRVIERYRMDHGFAPDTRPELPAGPVPMSELHRYRRRKQNPYTPNFAPRDDRDDDDDEDAEAFTIFVLSYLGTALWSSSDTNAEEGDDESLESKGYTVEDISEDGFDSARTDCLAFYESHGHLFEGKEEQAGHDFWLTRNGHGAGFWDRPEVYGQKAANELTKASKPYGESYLYVGDDGEIYIS
jgi:hypothetical protein